MAVAGLLIATYGYAQRLRMEPKLEDKVPERKVQPDRLREPEKKPLKNEGWEELDDLNIGHHPELH